MFCCKFVLPHTNLSCCDCFLYPSRKYTNGITFSSFSSDILDKDRTDVEIISFALGALINVVSEEVDSEETDVPGDIGKQT